MGHLTQIQADLVAAQKAKDQLTVSTLRYLLAILHNTKIEKGKELTDQELITVLQKESKRHIESIEAFESAARQDLVAKELAENAIIEKYLPKRLTVKEIDQLVDEVIADLDAQGKGDFGKVMGMVVVKAAGRAEGGQIAQIVKARLGKA